MAESDIIPIGTKVLFNCGVDGKTKAIGVVLANALTNNGKFPYYIRILKDIDDSRTGQPLEKEWYCSRGAIVEVILDDAEPVFDPIKAYDRAMRGI